MNIVSEIVTSLKTSEDFVIAEKAIYELYQHYFCEVMEKAIDQLDKELVSEYTKNGWEIAGFTSRTMTSLFGNLKLKRRRLRKKEKKSIVPMDDYLGLEAYKRVTPGVAKKVCLLSCQMTYRLAATSVELLTPFELSHQTIHTLVQEVGEHFQKVESQLNELDNQSGKKEIDYLFVEGDGVRVGSRGDESLEIHRVIIHEGVEKASESRHRLRNPAYFAILNSAQKAMNQASSYLQSHYRLRNTTVLSNSDGGSGYEKEKFDDLIGLCEAHHHFRDRYHVLKKIKERLRHDPQMCQEILLAVGSADQEKVQVLLHTAESRCETAEELEFVQKLGAYLERNWPYIPNLNQRNLEINRGIGICESGHRYYTYRMKRQGRSWGAPGARNLVAIITAQLNNRFDEMFMMTVKEITKFEVSETLSAAPYLKQTKRESVGVITGRIPNNGPSSSSMGNLQKLLG